MSNYADGTYQSPYGMIHVHNPGSKHQPENLQTLRREGGQFAIDGFVYAKDAGAVVLQGPALRSFRDAEKRATSRRLKRKGKVDPIILTGVGYRSYDVQRALYEGPDNTGGTRFADPDGSLHVEALAIDNHMGFFQALRKKRVRGALVACGWHFAVSGEPWHASFRLEG